VSVRGRPRVLKRRQQNEEGGYLNKRVENKFLGAGIILFLIFVVSALTAVYALGFLRMLTP
jgi:hypothetical protein